MRTFIITLLLATGSGCGRAHGGPSYNVNDSSSVQRLGTQNSSSGASNSADVNCLMGAGGYHVQLQLLQIADGSFNATYSYGMQDVANVTTYIGSGLSCKIASGPMVASVSDEIPIVIACTGGSASSQIDSLYLNAVDTSGYDDGATTPSTWFQYDFTVNSKSQLLDKRSIDSDPGSCQYSH